MLHYNIMKERVQLIGRPDLISAGRWMIFFLGLLGAISITTSNQASPQLILLTLLSVIAINFSIPLARDVISPILPVVAMSGLLVVGLEPTLVVMATAFLLAVEAHGEQLRVENQAGGGSCFVFTLPGIPLFF